jgi:hypothetical protein
MDRTRSQGCCACSWGAPMHRGATRGLGFRLAEESGLACCASPAEFLRKCELTRLIIGTGLQLQLPTGRLAKGVMPVTDSHKLLLSFILTLIGSGFGTTIVAVVLKRRFDERLELLKAVLGRGSRIHERQIDALMTIHSKLEGASFYLQRVASASRLKGEDESRLLERAGQELASASAEYSQKRLLFSDTLTGRIDEFFTNALSATLRIDLAMDPMMQDGTSRGEFWDKAREAVYRQLPAILQAIRVEARAVIHGSPS